MAKSTASFGTAASLIVRNSSSAYDTVEKASYTAQVSSLILDFDRTGFHADQIKPVMSPEDMAVRRTLLQGLQRYAEMLEEISGNHASDELNTQVAGLGQQLLSLSNTSAVQKMAPHATATELTAFTTGIDALGQFLIERKRRRALPGIMREMQGPMEQICALLNMDLGMRPDSDGNGENGLRGQLWTEYTTLIDNQREFIRRGKIVSPAERAAEIAKLPFLASQQRAADSALATVQAALGDMAAAHRALQKAPQGSGSFAGHVGDMIEDGRRIGEFYNSLKF